MKRRHEIIRRAKRLQRRREAVKLTLFLFLAGAILVGLILFLRLDRWLIEEVVVDGNKLISSTEISELVKSELRGNYWWFFPKSHVLWYPKRASEQKLLASFPALASAELRLSRLKTVVVHVEERKSKFVWCLSGTEAGCYFTDDGGLIFSEAPRSPADAFTEFVGPLPSDPLGRHPLPEAQFRKMASLAAELGNWLDSLGQIVVGEDGDFEFRLRRPSNESDRRVLRLFFNINQDLNGALTNLRSALTAEGLQKIFRTDPLDLEYVDLRFPPKVFYKVRQ